MTIKEKIYEIVARRTKTNISDLDNDMSLKKDLGADSIDTVEIMFDIEEYYTISIDDIDAETINTIDDAINIVTKLVESG
jgi:acyl carrier protein